MFHLLKDFVPSGKDSERPVRRLSAESPLGWLPATLGDISGGETHLVDPASSHMLVSKIKPCMSQSKLLYGETANGSLKQLQFF